jgi:hypothetical protein
MTVPNNLFENILATKNLKDFPQRNLKDDYKIHRKEKFLIFLLKIIK